MLYKTYKKTPQNLQKTKNGINYPKKLQKPPASYKTTTAPKTLSKL